MGCTSEMDAFNYILLGLCAINVLFSIATSKTHGPVVFAFVIFAAYALLCVAESVKGSP